MNQIYNLLQTIEDDKAQVAKLKRQLHNAVSILEAHTAALTRLTSIPEISQPKEEKSSLSPSQEVTDKVRVTMENVLDLGIEEGDTIEIVRTADRDFEFGQRCTVQEIDPNEVNLYFKLYPNRRGGIDWYDFEYGCSQPRDHELYLIKSQENK